MEAWGGINYINKNVKLKQIDVEMKIFFGCFDCCGCILLINRIQSFQSKNQMSAFVQLYTTLKLYFVFCKWFNTFFNLLLFSCWKKEKRRGKKN